MWYSVSMIVNIFHMLFACSSDVTAPSCDSDDGACFKGVFRTLLGQPVQDVEVCVLDDVEIPCVISDEMGQWKIPGLPLNSNIILTAEHPEYVSSLFGQHTSMDWYDWYKVAIPKTIMTTNANRLDLELDTSKGNILFLTWEGLNIDGIDTPNVPDVILSNSSEYSNVFYGDAIGLASTNQDATTGSGSGGILNLTEGTHYLKLDAQLGACAQEHMFHFQTDEDGIPVPVRAGFTTAIDTICPTLE